MDERIDEIAQRHYVDEDVVISLLADPSFSNDLDLIDSHLEDNGTPYGPFTSDIELAQSMAEDTLPDWSDRGWPYYCVDWDYAARELMHDFSRIESVAGYGYYYIHW